MNWMVQGFERRVRPNLDMNSADDRFDLFMQMRAERRKRSHVRPKPYIYRLLPISIVLDTTARKIKYKAKPCKIVYHRK